MKHDWVGRYWTFALVFLSGATGLIYQVTWHKYLENFLGSHAFSSAVILSVFFLFLALGNAAFGKSAHKLLSNKLLLYGIIEGAIGLYALLSPQIYRLLDYGFGFYLASTALDIFRGFAVTALFIGFPTFLMGGTIPVLTQGLTPTFDVSRKIHSLVYSINAAGAFIGTLITGFYFIEVLGLPATLTLAGCLNILILLITFLTFKRNPSGYQGPPLVSVEIASDMNGDDSTPIAKRDASTYWLLGISFVSGFYVFSLENLLIRMAGLSIGSSAYTYTIVVASFIFAIAVGSFSIAFFRSIKDFRFLLSVQLFLLASSLATYFLIPQWPLIFHRVRVIFNPALANFGLYWALVFTAFLLLLLVPVGLMGMNLPLLFHYLKQGDKPLSASVGRVYSINALGSFLGALIGGYVVFLFLNGAQVFLLNLSLMALTPWMTLHLFRHSTRFLKPIYFLLLAGLIWVIPEWKPQSFTPGLFLSPTIDRLQSSYLDASKTIRTGQSKEPIIFSRFDPNTVVDVVREESAERKPLTLYVNAKPDANTARDHTTRSLNALIPGALAPKRERIFIVGLGTGWSFSVARQMPDVESITVAEISSGVIDSMSVFEAYHLPIPKNPPETQILNGDAFKILRNQDKKYDMIVSEPSNPTVTGVEKLYTLEFIELVSNSLTKEGVFSQWMPIFNIDNESFKNLLRNYYEVFPWVTVWSSTGKALIILASHTPPSPSREHLQEFFEPQRKLFSSLGLSTPVSILGFQLLPQMTGMGLANTAKGIHTLENPSMHFNAIRANFVGQSGNLDTILHTALKRPLPINEETKFIYERFTPLDDSFFEDNLKLIDKHPTFEFHRQRLSYFLRAQDPTSPLVKMTEEEWGRYRAINEGRNVDWEPIEGDVANKMAARNAFFDELFDSYDELMYMHLTPKLKVLKRSIQDYCCEGPCAKAYWHYFRRHPRTSNEWAQSDFSKLTAEERQKIRNRAEKWGCLRTSQFRRAERTWLRG